MSYKPQIYDKEKVTFNLIVYKKHGKHFEIAVDPDLAIEYKNKKKDNKEDLVELLKAEKIFSDTKKGLRAPVEELEEAFQTTEFFKIAQIMITEGEIQLTSEHREHLRQEKRNKIVNLIHRQAIDPRTGAPHPVTRIENALVEAKVRIDEFKKAEDQIQDVLHKLKPIMPIKIDQKKYRVTLTVNYASKLQGTLKEYGKMSKEAWLPNGSFSCELEIPAGLQSEMMDELNNKTHGTVVLDELKN